MWKDYSEIYLRGNMMGMTEVKHNHNTFLWFLIVTKSMILHVLHISYQETR